MWKINIIKRYRKNVKIERWIERERDRENEWFRNIGRNYVEQKTMEKYKYKSDVIKQKKIA